eukprot:65636_1
MQNLRYGIGNAPSQGPPSQASSIQTRGDDSSQTRGDEYNLSFAPVLPTPGDQAIDQAEERETETVLIICKEPLHPTESLYITESFIERVNHWHERHQRWIVLVIGCLGMFAYSYCYDNVVALQNELQSTYHLTNIQYNLLYSVYAFPNILIPTFIGILNDYVGVNTTVLLCFSTITVGHGIYIIGCWVSSYSVMLVGRFIFGIGSESYIVVITTLLYEYFVHKELALAFALLLSLSRVGSSVNDVATYYFYTKTNSIIFANSVGFVLLIICLALLIALVFHRINSKSELLRLTHNALDQSHQDINDRFSWRDLRNFDIVYWLVVLNCGVIYGYVMSWMNIGTDFLQTAYGYTQQKANLLLMIPYIIGSIATPMFGILSDHIGKRVHLLCIATVMLVMSHFFMGFENVVTPIVALTGLGISYSIFCAVIWPSFAQVIDDTCVGTAYGIPTSFYNVVVSIDYIIVGALTGNGNVDPGDKYVNVEWFLLSFSLFSGVSILVLGYFDGRTGNRLNQPAIQN